MHVLKSFAFALVVSMVPMAIPSAFAGATDPLFVNTSTDESHRVLMAFTFSKKQLEQKHPVTVFLNDKAVLVASKANAEKFKKQQELLAGLIKDGATVIICQMCMKNYNVAGTDLLPGIELGNPEKVGALLFKDNTKTLAW
jgi:sulfur relay (sulfurtransferase) complex TusBCD TusD component (DsrE family)